MEISNSILFMFVQAESTKQSTRLKVPDALEESNDQIASTSDAKVCADIYLRESVWLEVLIHKLPVVSSDHATLIAKIRRIYLSLCYSNVPSFAVARSLFYDLKVTYPVVCITDYCGQFYPS